MAVPIRIARKPALVTQWLVIQALLQREVITRFGQYKLGIFWMLFEPLLAVIMIGVIIGPIAGLYCHLRSHTLSFYLTAAFSSSYLLEACKPELRQLKPIKDFYPIPQ